MEKVEDMGAQLKPRKTLMTSKSQMTKRRGEEERGKASDIHALAKNVEENLVSGGGKHTPKRRNTVFTEGLEFASPAKKQTLNINNLQKCWAKLEVETPKSSSLSKTGHNEGKLVYQSAMPQPRLATD
jgi:hypothetical protein